MGNILSRKNRRVKDQTNIAYPRQDVAYPRLFSGTIKFEKEDVIGKGDSVVYRGSYNGKSIAVKKVELKHLPFMEEIASKIKLEHLNVVKILTVEQDTDFGYIVLELCYGTLRDVCSGTFLESIPLPSDKIVLHEIADGLNYIHSEKLIHHNIKPQNILISCYGHIKISDFGLNKKAKSSYADTRAWMAPELVNSLLNNSTNHTAVEMEGSSESDLFSAGCVFFYFVTRGIHLYGESDVVENIRQNKRVNIAKLNNDHFAVDIINGLTQHKKGDRMSLEKVLNILVPFKQVDNPFEDMGIRYVRCVNFHPTDPVLACGLQDGRVVLLKGSDHSISFPHWIIERELGGKKEISLLQWNVDGAKLAAASVDGVIVVWRYPSYERIFKKKLNTWHGFQIVWNPFNCDVLAVYEMGEEKKLQVWNTVTRKYLVCEIHPDSNICDVKWISNNRLACSRDDGRINIHEISDGRSNKLVDRFESKPITDEIIDPIYPTSCLAWNDGLQLLATTSRGKHILVWSIEKNDPVNSLEVESTCHSLAWRPNARTENNVVHDRQLPALIACGLGNGSIVVWTPLEKDANPQYLKEHDPENGRAVINDLLFSPDGRKLVSHVCGGDLVVWCTKTWESIYTLSFGSAFKWVDWDVTSSKLAMYTASHRIAPLQMLEYVKGNKMENC